MSRAGLRLALPEGLLAAGMPKGPPGLHLDWSGLDRAARLIARLGAAPVRRRKSDAPEHDVAAAEHGGYSGRGAAGVASKGAGFLARAQDLSPGPAIAPAGAGAGRLVAGHGAGGAKGEAALGSARGGAARSRAAIRAAVQVAARAATQANVGVQGGAALDPASFAALGGPSDLNVAVATGVGQAGRAMQAATRLPAWMAEMADGANPRTAMATEGGHAPSWAAPTWMRTGAGLVRPDASGVAGESLAWLAPAQGTPAAPRAAFVADEAGRGWPSSSEQDRGEPFASSSGARAADAWASPAGTPGPVAPSEGEVGFAGFGAAEEAKRRVLDEMARLAARPPAGITGFDAGQTPAWLGGWTGGM